MRNTADKLFRGILIAAAIFCALYFLGSLKKTVKFDSNGQELAAGVDAPDFTVKTADGGTFRLSDYSGVSGKVVILNFWATWCGPCCGEMPAFQRLHSEYGDRLKVMAVNYGESKSTVKQFLNEYGYTFTVGLDEKGSVSALYPSDGIPYTLVIDKYGVITDTFIGARGADIQYEVYKQAIEKALNV
ncbi:MAG: TlpA family protein disulfide reductase [Clostridiales bacterium]|nr:TlpA family protein disulfide reductase [Clostridiales bacterium]